ncbi:MAG: DedA family protein [Candidatus Paceibacterota bacterium]|jgi:membrane protein DedA with SNARE-associated domain
MSEQSIDVFIQLVQDHRAWGYVVLFFAMVIEGEIILIVAGMLARLKALDLGDVLWVSFAGVMIGDALWYGLGMITLRSKRFAKLATYAEKSVHTFLPHFRTKPLQSIMLSKFIYGANHATLIVSGIMRVRFATFIKAEALASFVWIAVYSVAGFMFGHAALAVTHKALRFALIAFIFVVGFILIQRWATKVYEQRELEEDKNNNA